jgi:DNA topoisomerase VI subunit B
LSILCNFIVSSRIIVDYRMSHRTKAKFLLENSALTGFADFKSSIIQSTIELCTNSIDSMASNIRIELIANYCLDKQALKIDIKIFDDGNGIQNLNSIFHIFGASQNLSERSVKQFGQYGVGLKAVVLFAQKFSQNNKITPILISTSQSGERFLHTCLVGIDLLTDEILIETDENLLPFQAEERKPDLLSHGTMMEFSVSIETPKADAMNMTSSISKHLVSFFERIKLYSTHSAKIKIAFHNLFPIALGLSKSEITIETHSIHEIMEFTREIIPRVESTSETEEQTYLTQMKIFQTIFQTYFKVPEQFVGCGHTMIEVGSSNGNIHAQVYVIASPLLHNIANDAIETNTPISGNATIMGNTTCLLHILRYVNGIPLLKETKDCCITKAILESKRDWYEFGLKLQTIDTLERDGALRKRHKRNAVKRSSDVDSMIQGKKLDKSEETNIFYESNKDLLQLQPATTSAFDLSEIDFQGVYCLTRALPELNQGIPFNNIRILVNVTVEPDEDMEKIPIEFNGLTKSSLADNPLYRKVIKQSLYDAFCDLREKVHPIIPKCLISVQELHEYQLHSHILPSIAHELTIFLHNSPQKLAPLIEKNMHRFNVQDFSSLEADILKSLKTVATSAQAATKAAHDTHDQMNLIQVSENIFGDHEELVERDDFDMVEETIAKVHELNAIKKILSLTKISKQNEKRVGELELTSINTAAEEIDTEMIYEMSASPFGSFSSTSSTSSSLLDLPLHSLGVDNNKERNWWEGEQIQTAELALDQAESIGDVSDFELEWDESIYLEDQVFN